MTVEKTIRDFHDATPEHPLVIPLLPVSLQLDPAMVSPVDPLLVVKTAYSLVKQNYATQHVAMTGFYRELIQRGSRYIVLNEAVLDIDKAPSNSYTPDRAMIYKGRGSINYDIHDTLAVKFQGGIHSALEFDIVKEPFPGCYLADIEDCYLFKMELPASIDGRSFYVVSFDQKPGLEDILYRGRLFIDSETFAIARAEVTMNVESREESASRYFIKSKPLRYHTYIDESTYTITYKLMEDGKWSYDYIKMDLSFSTRRRFIPFRTHYHVTNELAVTDRREEQLTIAKEERVREKDILSDQVSDFTDPDFWGEYNIIEPDSDIQDILRRIVRQMNRH